MVCKHGQSDVIKSGSGMIPFITECEAAAALLGKPGIPTVALSVFLM